ncbi:MAG TPA: hypothetical protein GX002_02705 [Clostridiales bacterium]|nr:hypothetical protein [Clostridiales bacterium]
MIKIKRKKYILIILCLMLSFLSIPNTAYAAEPYKSYTYTARMQGIPSLNGYSPEEVYVGADFGTDGFNAPKDLRFDSEGNLYIVDTGNSRIIKLNGALELVAVINSFDNQGEKDFFNQPEGMFITKEGNIYVADTQNSRVIKFDSEFNLLKTLDKPDMGGLSTTEEYKPQKVAVDDSERIFVVSAGSIEGLIQISQEGDFIRFFGSNIVKPDFFELALRKFLTKEQREKRMIFLPTEYSNVIVDNSGFLMTTTLNVSIDAVKRLNSKGSNIMRHDGRTGDEYGDVTYEWRETKPQFVDLVIDEYDNMLCLDRTSGKIFQYNSFGDLLFQFGGKGSAKGLFQSPSAIEHKDNKVYVLDERNNDLTVFVTTDFGEKVLIANALYIAGSYEESLEPWQEVIRMNSNYDLAYKGIGKALFRMGNYKEAMKNFKLAYSYKDYSKAKAEYRTQVLRENFSLIVIIIIAVIIAIRLLFRWLHKKNIYIKKIIEGYDFRRGEVR